MTPRYPFSAVVGQPDLRTALLLNAVSPAVGGVLVRGEKGTAKSTMVRALAALLPAVSVVAGCRFSCDPAEPDPDCPDGPHEGGADLVRPARLVELPVGASEDRVVGALDLERALTEGVRAFQPGLLAAAHRGVLYVDEVNLLPDHLVDLLLDAAALGRCTVEREGVSVEHAARFLLVGTMNPEEGELRPQLLDRFGLTVEVAASRDHGERAEVVRRALGYEAAPADFAAGWAAAEAELAEQVRASRRRLPAVVLGDGALRAVTAACAAFDADGMRGDLVTARTAIALAAWEGRSAVDLEDVRRAALLALPHRRRRNPFDEPGLDPERLEDALQSTLDEPEPPPDAPPDLPPDPPPGGGTPTPGGRGEPVGAGTPFAVSRVALPGRGRGPAGQRSPATTDTGRVVGARLAAGPVRRLHLPATLAAAAPHQQARGRAGPGLVVRRGDLRTAVRQGREANLVLFAVDASGSMAARARMGAVKTAVLSLLMDAYQRRDTVGLVTFRGEEATLALPPTGSVEVAAARLADLATGGRTPLAAGLARAGEVLRIARLREADRRALLVLVTDGRATSGGPDPVAAARAAARSLGRRGVAALVVDCEAGLVRLGLAALLAADLAAPVVALADVGAAGLAAAVRARRVA
ncbi:MAG: VWA domain-containing protein [Mycobacteriales bacterium]